ncbi:12351_t:CDS:1, partial [Entrophospora sp. SA101]
SVAGNERCLALAKSKGCIWMITTEHQRVWREQRARIERNGIVTEYDMNQTDEETWYSVVDELI